LLPDVGETVQRAGLGAGTALMRELHIYGEMEKISEQTAKKAQHK
jgi:histone acetyltransferase (RNA polymerase elongator complex component)